MMTPKVRRIHQRVEVKLARMISKLRPMDPATEILNGPILPWSRPPTTKQIPSTIHSENHLTHREKKEPGSHARFPLFRRAHESFGRGPA
jgi:hypothetical protein